MTETATLRAKREKGSGCLIPPRPNVTSFWTVQVQDQNGRAVRRSTKVRGELKPGCDPKVPESWTNITAAKAFLKDLVKSTDAGVVKVGSDPSQLRYGALRQLYMNDYREQEHKSLMKNSETAADYVCGLKWLDQFFGYVETAEGNAEEKGDRVATISPERISQFKTERTEAGAANGTINRSLAALRRMFSLAQQDELLQTAPFIRMLPEPKQPRQGFLNEADYQRLYAALAVEVKNQATGEVSRPSAYLQPILQTGYYTGMRLSEILNLRWANVDLAGKFIHLFAGETKNDEARDIPLIGGLTEILEGIRRANPAAGPNDLVFTNNGQPIRSFIKAWRKACVKAAIPTKLNGQVVISHFKGGKYCGFVFHDLRRTFVSNLVEAGVDPLDAKAISGHKTDSVFQRYNIKSLKRAQNAGDKLSEDLLRKQQEAATAPVRLVVVK
jgi:integrase